MIEDYMNTQFTLYKKTETKVDGRLKTEYVASLISYLCAHFTPSQTKQVRFGKNDYIVAKNMYCSTDVPVVEGDYVKILGKDYDVVGVQNTNSLNHHLTCSLSSR